MSDSGKRPESPGERLEALDRIEDIAKEMRFHDVVDAVVRERGQIINGIANKLAVND